MPVSSSKSGGRAFAVLEELANRQPIGVSELARALAQDKSSIQRALKTLHDAGWISPLPGGQTRWQLTGRIHSVAGLALNSSDLRQRALSVLTALRARTHETLSLAIPDGDRFVVIEVVESQQMLRAVPRIGMPIDLSESATGKVVLPHYAPERVVEILGSAPDDAFAEAFEIASRQGYYVRDDDFVGASINIAAPIFEADGMPAATLILSAPMGRFPRALAAETGEIIAEAARHLSRGVPRRARAQAATERTGMFHKNEMRGLEWQG